MRAPSGAKKTNMRLLGVVENMSYLVGTGETIFGEGGGEELARTIGVPLLGRIPLDPRSAAQADVGDLSCSGLPTPSRARLSSPSRRRSSRPAASAASARPRRLPLLQRS